MALEFDGLEEDFRSPPACLIFSGPDKLALRRIDFSSEHWKLSHVEGWILEHSLELLTANEGKLLLALLFLGDIDLAKNVCGL